jgi:transposase
MKRYTLSDAQWEQVQPLLPPQKPATGRPAKDHRTVIDGILWQRATGAPWRDLPERFGPWQTIYSRYRRWQQSGVWDRLRTALGVDGEKILPLGDATTVRVLQTTPVTTQEVVTVPASRRESPSSGSNSNGLASRWSTW